MKHTKTVMVPETTKQVVDKITCDFCGEEIKEAQHTVDDVVLSYRTGVEYPEGGRGELTEIDICGKCFLNKLIPWVNSQGVVPITSKWDW